MATLDVRAAMGKVGLPAPISELAARDWDAVVVGGGHNGLTAAAYLARAGQSVLVLERREQLGGACTLEQPFSDPRFIVSPCAYVVGLLDQLVVDELGLERHGYHVYPADPNLWCPFADGTSFASFIDFERTASHLRDNGFAEGDIAGLAAYESLFARARARLREGPLGDTWVGPSPTRAEIEEALDDPQLVDLVFNDSIVALIDRHIDDERLRDAIFGQGIIGTYAAPTDPGTASIKLMHHQGDLYGLGSVWGYVRGGMGTISFAIAQSALESGATLAAGTPVARILPGEGVELESGDRIRARRVICNADPKRALAMLGDHVPDGYRDRLDGWRIESPVVKLNVALDRLPHFPAAAAGDVEPQRTMITITPGVDAAVEAFAACRRGEPRIGFAELYFQTGYDPGVAPEGKHVMSVFAHYAPYELATGDWDTRADEIAGLILDEIAVHAPDVRECVAEHQLLGPPDIESRIGLTRGHIFQGDALPDQMWDRRLEARTPIPGFYMCGAATHPGGSVIALNGRNAAFAAIEDAEREGAPTAG
jgi:phytoene dehydrogenase-like protein